MASNDWDAITAQHPPQGARDANAAIAGTYGVTPANGASALTDAPLAGTDPSVAMRTPQETADLAANASRNSVLSAHPAVASWVASAPPAHVAASKDSLPALGAVNYAADAWKGYSGPVDSIAQALKGAWEGLQKQAATSAQTATSPQYFGQNEVEFVKLLGSTVGLIGSGFAAGTDPLARAYASLPLPMYGAGDLQGKNPLNADQRIAQARADTGLALWGLTAVGGKAAPTDLGTAEMRPASSAPPSGPITDAEFTDIVKPPLAIADQRVIEHLQETVANTDLHSASPSTMESFLSHALPDQTVGVDPEKLVELARKGDEVFPERAGEIAAAHADGADVEVPLSRYLTATAGQPFAGELNAATTFREGGVSTEEGKGLTEVASPSPQEAALSQVTNQIRELHEQMDALIPPSDHPHGHSYRDMEPFFASDPKLAELGSRFDALDIARARLESQPAYEAVLRNLPPGWTAQRAIRNYTNSEVPGLRRHLLRIEVFNEHGKIVHGDALEQDVAGFRKDIEAGRKVPSAHEAASIAAHGEGGPANDTDLDELNALIEEFGPKPIKAEGVVKLKGDEFEGLTPPETSRAKSIAAAYSDTISRALEPYLAPLVKGPDALGMTKPQFERYSASVEALVERTQARAYEASRAQVMRERKPDFVEAAKQHSADVERELAARRDVQAQHALVRNTGPLGEPLKRPPMKINREDALNAYGSQLVNSVHQGVFGAKGLHPDEVAELLGYGSGREMMGELAALHDQEVRMGVEGKPLTPREHLQTLAKAIGHNRAAEALGFDLSPEGIHEAASAMVHEPDLTSFLTDELRAMGATPLEIEDVKGRAAERFGSLSVKEALKIKKLEGNLYKTSRKLQDALQKGDARATFIRAQQQFLHHLILKDAHEFLKEARQGLKSFSRFADEKSISSMDQDYLDAIHGVLKDQGYSVPQGNLRFNYADYARRAEANMEPVQPYVPIQGGRPENLSVNDFRLLKARVDTLAHLGREARKVTVAGKKQDLADLVDEAKETAAEVARRAVDTQAVPRRSLLNLAGRFDAWNYHVETMIDIMDGGDPNGPFNRMLMRGSRRSAGDNVSVLSDTNTALGKLVEDMSPGQRTRLLTRVADGHGLMDPVHPDHEMKLLHQDLIGIALHAGSGEGRWHLEEGGMGWDPVVYNAALSNMHSEDWALTNALHAELEKMWPKIAEGEKSLTGVVPERREAVPVRLDNGETHPGGYWPLRRDDARNSQLKGGVKTDQADLNEHFFAAAATPRGHTMKVTWAKYVPSLDWQQTLREHVPSVAKRIAYGQWIMDANKFLRQTDIVRLINDIHGPSANKQFNNWMHRQVGMGIQDPRIPAAVNLAARELRLRTYAVATGLKISIGLEHLTSIAQTSGVTGVGLPVRAYANATARGILHYIANPNETLKFVEDTSPYMRARHDATTRELADAYADVRNPKRLLPFDIPGVDHAQDLVRKFTAAFFNFVNHRFVAVPTWMQAYNEARAGTAKFLGKTVDAMDHEGASAFADKVIGKSHGSGLELDMSAFQSGGGNEPAKLMNMYNVFRGTIGHLQREGMWHAVHDKDLSSRVNGLYQLLMAGMGTVMVGKLVTDQWPKNPEDPGEWAMWAMNSMFNALSHTIPYGDHLYRAADAYLSKKPLDVSLSPAESTLTYSAKGAADIVSAVRKVSGDKHAPHVGKRWIEDVGTMLGFMSSAPLGQPSETLQVLYDMSKGKVARLGVSLAFGPSHEGKQKVASGGGTTSGRNSGRGGR